VREETDELLKKGQNMVEKVVPGLGKEDSTEEKEEKDEKEEKEEKEEEEEKEEQNGGRSLAVTIILLIIYLGQTVNS